jgi:AraC-like DNA-binding protein
MVSFADLNWFENKQVRQASWTPQTSRAGDPFIVARVANENFHGLAGTDALHTDYAAITIYLQDMPSRRLWRDGRRIPCPPSTKGMVDIFDRRYRWWVEPPRAFDCAELFVPMSMLDDLAEDGEAPRIQVLRAAENMGSTDQLLYHLALALVPALDHQTETSSLFADHVASALLLHLAQRYGGFDVCALSRRGGLAPWQERRAKDYIAENLHGKFDVAELAAMCGLSPSHFRYAFRQTIGAPPHQWLLEQRIEKAKDLLVNTTASLREVGLETGFPDQSHFTRVFSQRVKASPAAWRKAHHS